MANEIITSVIAEYANQLTILGGCTTIYNNDFPFIMKRTNNRYGYISYVHNNLILHIHFTSSEIEIKGYVFDTKQNTDEIINTVKNNKWSSICKISYTTDFIDFIKQLEQQLVDV